MHFQGANAVEIWLVQTYLRHLIQECRYRHRKIEWSVIEYRLIRSLQNVRDFQLLETIRDSLQERIESIHLASAQLIANVVKTKRRHSDEYRKRIQQGVQKKNMK